MSTEEKDDNVAASQSSVSPVRIHCDCRPAKKTLEELVKRHLTPDVVVIDPLYPKSEKP